MENGYRLLVVEDDVFLCESIAELLRFSGYAVETAQDGESALRLAVGAPRLDAILLDVVLPHMTAQRFLRDLERSCQPRPPVVLMTGMVSGAQALPETDDLLLKPFDVEELLARMARVCAPRAAPIS
jgi:DNA-binding response OmpR family regulator